MACLDAGIEAHQRQRQVGSMQAQVGQHRGEARPCTRPNTNATCANGARHDGTRLFSAPSNTVAIVTNRRLGTRTRPRTANDRVRNVPGKCRDYFEDIGAEACQNAVPSGRCDTE
jgi:hypothetical protein